MKSLILVSSLVTVAARVQRCPVLEKKRSTVSFLQRQMKPGTGMDLEKIKANRGTIYKDGYYHVACLNDGMRISADKHGDGKFKYAADNIEVSIVWYENAVPSEDRKDMTPDVCYQFCRTVEGMNFFGIQNGRGCYCTPYYKAAAGSGSEQCDAPCDGDSAQTCGGKTKSDIYQMHYCGDVGENVTNSIGLVEEASTDLGAAKDTLKTCSDNLQKVGEDLQKLGNGDKWVGNWGQQAKVAAGNFAAQIRDSGKTLDASSKLVADGNSLGDLKNAENAEKAERALTGLEAAQADLNSAIRGVSESADACGVNPSDDADSLARFLPAMHFVDKGFSDSSASCSGDAIGSVSSRSAAACASLCSDTTYPTKCLAFQHYHAGGNDACVLFSAISDLSYYSGSDCKTVGDAQCYVKMSESTGFAPKNGAENQQRCFFK